MAHIAMHDGQLQTIQFNLKQNLKKFLDALRWAEWWLDGLIFFFLLIKKKLLVSQEEGKFQLCEEKHIYIYIIMTADD